MYMVFQCDYCEHTTKVASTMIQHEVDCPFDAKHKKCTTCYYCTTDSGDMCCDTTGEYVHASFTCSDYKWEYEE